MDEIKFEETMDRIMPDAKERRRYALLQAAATILAGLVACPQLDEPSFKGTVKPWDEDMYEVPWLVTRAEQLLTEIERREDGREVRG